MKRTRASFTIAQIIAGLVVIVTGCGERTAPAPPAKVSVPSVRTYKLVGVVKQLEKSSGVVAIAHEEIPDFMGAMTMSFTLKRKDLLDDVRVGDEVEGSLRVESEDGLVKDYEITKLEVTRPAPPPSLNLTVSGGSVEVARAVKILEPGQPVPDFTFTTQEGMERKLSDFRGKVVVLTFIYTRCPLPDFCPAIDRKFAELADKVGAIADRAEHVRLLSVSFDPEHDTPAVLREHARIQGAKPPLWTFAVASHPELYKIMRELGLTYGPTGKEIMHNLTTAVIDEKGRLARLERGKEWKALDLLKTIADLIKSNRPTGR